MTQHRSVSSLKNSKTSPYLKVVELDQSADARTRDADLIPAEARRNYVNNDLVLKTRIVGVNAALKRGFDFVVGSLALLLLMPLFILLSVLIKLGSTGPALFYQKRRGRHGELIKVYKFRTMFQKHSTPVPTATSFKQTEKDDPRVTRLGALLRKTSLDELPQLFNVVQGTMSLVGPRPHPKPLDDQFKNIIPALDSRYAVKPGLTGWAQVHGYRGETKRVEDMVARVEHDRYYIKHWTLWLDIKIIVMTTFIGWTGRNAY